ncbi:MAG: hypothetical protein A2289_16315 [Deltaproteobacteria bacterium RIFOXYA12_FULL_58_15]|nr:MAG: hypothetical protein A2289_16315 [Deltaproteobacteria bacterium RIFOXYA12_FULL_58_15]
MNKLESAVSYPKLIQVEADSLLRQGSLSSRQIFELGVKAWFLGASSECTDKMGEEITRIAKMLPPDLAEVLVKGFDPQALKYLNIPNPNGNGYVPLFGSKADPCQYYYFTYGFTFDAQTVENGKTGLGLPPMKCLSIKTYENGFMIPDNIVSDLPLDHLNNIGGDSRRRVLPQFYGGEVDKKVTVYTLSPPEK